MSGALTNETSVSATFERDSCIVSLRVTHSDLLYVELFYCTGSSSIDNTNQKLRGAGKGKLLLLDALRYMQSKHSSLVNASIFPVPSMDPEKIEQIYKDEIDKYIESNEAMRISFEEEVMYRSDYPHWSKRYFDLDFDVKQKIIQYKTTQEQKLTRYYNSLGFMGDGPILYGILADVINTISHIISLAGTKKRITKQKRITKKNK